MPVKETDAAAYNRLTGPHKAAVARRKSRPDARLLAEPTLSPLQAAALRLQRSHGNRYVQRMLALARQGEGEAEVAPEIEAAIERERDGGQTLDRAVRAQMEPFFGTAFSRVRIHTGAQADMLNRALSARAFTTGGDIFFREGEYSPGSVGGKELLAHELTHVVQQGADCVHGKHTMSRPDDASELQADRLAKAVLLMRQPEEPSEVGYAQPADIARLCEDCQDEPHKKAVRVGDKKSQEIERQTPGHTTSAITPSTVRVWLNAFIPRSVPGKTTTAPPAHPGKTMLRGPIPGVSDCFLTDQRGFDPSIHAASRMHSEVEIAAAGPKLVSEWHHCYETNEIDCEDGAVECRAFGDTSRMKFSGLRGSAASVIGIDLAAAANDPCYANSPDIDYGGTLLIDVGRRSIYFDGKIDEFPAFEMYAAAAGSPGAAMFTTLPLPGKDPWNLPGGAKRTQVGSASL